MTFKNGCVIIELQQSDFTYKNKISKLMNETTYEARSMEETIKRTLETTAEEESTQLALIGYDDYPEIIIEGDNNKDIAVNMAFAYLDDLRLENLTEKYQAEQQKASCNSNEYRRLVNIGKAIQMLIENKEELGASLKKKLEGLNEADQYELIGSALSTLFAMLYDLFDKCQYPFVPMFNCTATSQLAVLSMAKPKKDMIARRMVYELGDAKAIIEEIDKVRGALRSSACKLFYAFLAKLTMQNSIKSKKKFPNPKVVITYEEYARFRGMEPTEDNINNLRAEVGRDMDVLMHLVLKWGRDGKMLNVSSFSKKIKGGVEFVFNPLIAPYATQFMIQFPLRLLELDSRNQSVFALGKKLSDHYTIDSNKLNETYNIISVQTLLKTCIDIPSYEQVQKGNRNITDRIIQPLEQKLNILRDVCGYLWQFCNARKMPLTDEQKELLTAGDYLTFQNLYIIFEIAGVPDQTERLERKAEERKAIAEKKKATTSKRKSSNGRSKRGNAHDPDAS